MKVTERFEKCYEIVCMMRNAESSLNEAMYYANDLGEDMKATEERIKKIIEDLNGINDCVCDYMKHINID